MSVAWLPCKSGATPNFLKDQDKKDSLVHPPSIRKMKAEMSRGLFLSYSFPPAFNRFSIDNPHQRILSQFRQNLRRTREISNLISQIYTKNWRTIQRHTSVRRSRIIVYRVTIYRARADSITRNIGDYRFRSSLSKIVLLKRACQLRYALISGEEMNMLVLPSDMHADRFTDPASIVQRASKRVVGLYFNACWKTKRQWDTVSSAVTLVAKDVELPSLSYAGPKIRCLSGRISR